jgi:hypothetical protein
LEESAGVGDVLNTVTATNNVEGFRVIAANHDVWKAEKFNLENLKKFKYTKKIRKELKMIEIGGQKG